MWSPGLKADVVAVIVDMHRNPCSRSQQGQGSPRALSHRTVQRTAAMKVHRRRLREPIPIGISTQSTIALGETLSVRAKPSTKS